MIPSTIDLTNCEQEPIHILGNIQSHGYLIAIDPATYSVVHASNNIIDLVGADVSQLLGQSVDKVLAGSDLPVGALTEILNVGQRNGSWDTINPHRLTLNGEDWNLIIHEQKGLVLLEWEPRGDNQNQLMNQQLISQALTEVQSSHTLDELLKNTARRVKAIIGFDRVMVYRFGEDWHGQVVAEAKEDHMEPFLGLHYPASDIPKQARELYKVNLVRLIADAGSVPSPILSRPGWPEDQPLDLTHSVLRAVSPVHIEYLKNMGVQASMSISLIYRGELWGLISCHNTSPHFVDYQARQAAKFVSQLLSAALEFRKDKEDLTNLHQYQQIGRELHQQLLQNEDVARSLTKMPVTALDITGASGAALMFNNKVYQLGKTPEDKQIRALAEWMGTTGTESFFQTSLLPTLYPPAKDFAAVGSGLLAIVLSRELNEYVFWFKPERIEQVTWAGNPDKPITVDDEGTRRLSPRKSFAAWTEIVRNTSEPWSEAELSVVVKLREDILQIVTKQANEIRLLNQRLQLAYEELDAFSYTVSHDLRTPLSSIRCYAEILLEEYGEEFSPDAQVLFQKVIDSTDRMRRLIRHILFYSRMGRTELDTQLIDMRQLLEGIREETLVTTKERSLRIDIGDTPSIMADPTMALQLFTNLISNAAKYTQLATEGWVQINGTQTSSEVVYSVEDNGIGFDMKHAGKIFDLFKRMENARAFEGSGVGLAIVKRIINRHQGKIWFHSEPNQGTTFFVSFPVNHTE